MRGTERRSAGREYPSKTRASRSKRRGDCGRAGGKTGGGNSCGQRQRHTDAYRTIRWWASTRDGKKCAGRTPMSSTTYWWTCLDDWDNTSAT